MNKLRLPPFSLHAFLALGLSVLLAVTGGCGGGGGSTATVETATVGITLTDDPTGAYDEALATISRIELLGDAGTVVLFSGLETIDLLKLADYSELFAVNEDVPAGSYNKVRLRLTDLELIDRDANGDVVESVRPKLVGNGKLDLNPQGPIVIVGGSTLVITLDFDMAKSLKLTETGNGQLILRPVVFVDIATDIPAPGLARIHGVISGIDNAAGTFRLCQTRLVAREDDDDGDRFGQCLRVETDGDTGVFGEDGLPLVFIGLTEGDEATVIGRLQPRVADDEDDDLDLDDRFRLLAVTVEQGTLGTFDRIQGIAATEVDSLTDRFALDVTPGQGLVTSGPLPAQLYPDTRIFTADGVEVGRDDILIGSDVIVDAVLALSSEPGAEDVLRTAFITLRADTAEETVLTGELLSVAPLTGVLVMQTETGERCVDASDADIFLVDEDDGLTSQRGELSDLEAGQTVNVFGREVSVGCFAAETVLADTEL